MFKRINIGLVIVLLLGVIFLLGNRFFWKDSDRTLQNQNNQSSGLKDVKDLILLNNNEKLTLKVEVAKTDYEIQYGLMNRTSLDADRGMLFAFNQDAPRSFWMKNTLIPLDMLFFDAKGEFVNVAEDAQPCKVADVDCPIYSSTGDAKYVLETNAGRIESKFFTSDLKIENINSF
jgi:uncharacterized membrane protein (UPF0127 family)